MHAALIPHPATPGRAVRSIEVEVSLLAPAELTLRYRVLGDIAGLVLPEPAPPVRTDELWRHSCFEVFVRLSPATTAYCEFNLSPSSEWAAYRFDSYRSGMAKLDISAPAIRTETTAESFTLRALVDLADGTELVHHAAWLVGLAAVIEEGDGRLSYWALAHAPDKPDFHHDHCFALQLPPARQQ
jgi:hypothetical protein